MRQAMRERLHEIAGSY